MAKNLRPECRKSLGCRGVSQGKTSPAYHSEKTYDFPALYICVGHQRVDEFWDAGWMAFVTTTGSCRSARCRPFLNGGFLEIEENGWVDGDCARDRGSARRASDPAYEQGAESLRID